MTLTVSSREVVALVGRSGSGKTTLLRLVAGLALAAVGEIWVGGVAVHALTAAGRRALRRGSVSVVFQDHNLIPELTAGENVRLALDICGRRTNASAATQAALNSVGLAAASGRRPGDLSGGESQRVAIARALAIGAGVILADEPTGSLDADNAAAVMRALHHAARQGSAVLVATHDPEVVGRATRSVRLDHGALVPS